MDDETASRLAALLANLQSFEYAIETFASFIDERTTWAVATLMEAWKASLRLRLLRHVPTGQLMSSFRREPEDNWSHVVTKLSSSLHKRAGSLASARTQRTAPVVNESYQIAARLLRAGDIMHILQPITYLVLIHWLGRRAPSFASSLPPTARRRLPWLTALAMEGGGLMLCTIGAQWLEHTQRQQKNGGSSQRRASSEAVKQNAIELRHRRTLLLLFLARPSACAAAHILLGHASRNGTSTGGGRSLGGLGSLGGFGASPVLELLDALDRSCWARYFRTSEVAEGHV